MKKLLPGALAAVLISAPVLVLAFAPAPDAGRKPVEHKTWNGYAESRDSGLKGDASFLALTAKSEFSRVFDPVLTPRGRPDVIPADAFDKQLFVAVIKRGDVLWDYKVEKVTANGDTLTVHYRATPHKGGDFPRGETAKAFGTAPIRTTVKGDSGGTAKAVDTGRVITTARAPASTEKAITTARAATTERAPAAAAKAEAPPRETVRARLDTVKYATTERAGGSSTVFDSPLILSVPKDKYASVVFVENGKKAGTVRVGN